MLITTTARNLSWRWSQDNNSVRWPPSAAVALSSAMSMQGDGRGSEQDFGTPTSTDTKVPTWWSAPSTHPQRPTLPETNDPYFPEAETGEDVEVHRDDALQYLERKKANIPNIGTRVKVRVREGAEAIKEGIIEGQVGYVLGKFAVEHGLANVPRMPATALIGVVEDAYHSRDSYVEICNQALDHARRELKKGKKPLIFSPPDNGEPNTTNSPSRHTCAAVPVWPKTEGPDAYMDLLDDPLVLPQKTPHSAPAALESQQKVRLAERSQRANKYYTGRDDFPKAATPDRHRTALQPGRENRVDRSVSWKPEPEPRVKHYEPIGQPAKAQTQWCPEASKAVREPMPLALHSPEIPKALLAPSEACGDKIIPQWRKNIPKPDCHPAALCSGVPLCSTNSLPPQDTKTGLTRTDSGRSLTLVKQEITQSWESGDIQIPGPLNVRKGAVHRLLSVNSQEKWEQKRVRRGTKVVGSGEISKINEAVAHIEKTSENPMSVAEPVGDLPYQPMPAEAIARFREVGKKPTEPVKTIMLNPQALSWDAETRTIRRCAAATPLNLQAKTWENEVKSAVPGSAAEVSFKPRAKTWESKPLPQIGVPIHLNRAHPTPLAAAPALNPQAKTWESKPLPQTGVPVKRKPGTSQTNASTIAEPQRPRIDAVEALNEFNRQRKAQLVPGTSNPVKFGDTHLVDPAVEYAKRVRAQKRGQGDFR